MDVTILLADPDSESLAAVSEKLTGDYSQFDIISAQQTSAVFEILADDQRPVECLVTEHGFPAGDGMGFLEDIRCDHPELPIILFTDSDRAAVADDALAAGATDYLKKDGSDETYQLLANRIEAFAEQYYTPERHSSVYQALETASEGIGLIGDDGRYIYLNEAYAELYGYDRDELIGTHWRRLYPDAEAERFRQEILPTLRKDGSWEGYSRGKRATGELFPEELSLTHLRGSDGGHICVVRDISNQKRRERQFETLANNLQGMVYRVRNEPAWPVEFAHGNVDAFLGYTTADLEDQDPNWNEVIHPDDRQRVWNAVQEAADNSERFEITYRVIAADGDTKWVIDRGRAVETDGDTAAFVDGLITDITERKRYELELEWKTNAMDESPMGIVIADPTQEDMPLVYANDGFTELTGYSNEDALGRNCRFLQGPLTDSAPVQEIRDAIANRETVDVDLLNYRKEKTPFWNNLQLSPISDADGELTHFVGFQNDVTERVESERRIAVLHRVLRHNLRNKLSVVLGHVDTLRENAAVPEETLQSIRAPTVDLLKTSEKARKIQAWLDEATFQPASIPVEDIIDRAVSHGTAINGELDVHVEVDSGLSVLAPESVVIAFRELIENAIVHSAASRPTVSITTEPDTITFERKDAIADAVVVHVDDTNVTIPDIDQARLLGDKESPVHHGTGLGLWLVNWVVTMSGGLIEHTERCDGGNRISITLLRAD